MGKFKNSNKVSPEGFRLNKNGLPILGNDVPVKQKRKVELLNEGITFYMDADRYDALLGDEDDEDFRY